MNEKILIVEDDLSLLDLYKTELGHHGYRILIAETGGMGLALAKKEKPSLVMADIMMPGMDGFSFIRALREEPELSETPVIVLTNLGTSPIFIEEGKRLGVSRYLIKYRTTLKEVIEAVTKAIGDK